MQNVIPLFEGITPDNSDTWNYLCQNVYNFENRVTLIGACWHWSAGYKMKIKGNSKGIRAASYEHAYCTPNYDYDYEPLKSYTGRKLTSTCGDRRCINPDHLTDRDWGFFEDLKFLLRTCVAVIDIPERMGTTQEGIVKKLLGSDRPEARKLLDKYRERQYNEANDVQTRNALALHMRRVEKHAKY